MWNMIQEALAFDTKERYMPYQKTKNEKHEIKVNRSGYISINQNL